jgi:hypothetical protein
MILAFMQNMWVRDPRRVQAMIDRQPDEVKRREFRSQIIKRLLFAGCKSGRVLRSVFGDWCDKIIWEEASPLIAGDSRTICPPDAAHINQALIYHAPSIVITFGKIAGDAVAPLWNNSQFIRAPHPAARQPDTRAKLMVARDRLAWMESSLRREHEENVRDAMGPLD